MRVERTLACLAAMTLGCAGAGEVADVSDEFLEYLGAADEAWLEACDQRGELPGDDVCEKIDDDHEDEL